MTKFKKISMRILSFILPVMIVLVSIFLIYNFLSTSVFRVKKIYGDENALPYIDLNTRAFSNYKQYIIHGKDISKSDNINSNAMISDEIMSELSSQFSDNFNKEIGYVNFAHRGADGSQTLIFALKNDEDYTVTAVSEGSITQFSAENEIKSSYVIYSDDGSPKSIFITDDDNNIYTVDCEKQECTSYKDTLDAISYSPSLSFASDENTLINAYTKSSSTLIAAINLKDNSVQTIEVDGTAVGIAKSPNSDELLIYSAANDFNGNFSQIDVLSLNTDSSQDTPSVKKISSISTPENKTYCIDSYHFKTASYGSEIAFTVLSPETENEFSVFCIDTQSSQLSAVQTVCTGNEIINGIDIYY